MAYTSKLRASTRHQVAVVKPVRRGLRKRQPSMRYAEKEYQMVPDEVANYISDRDGETDEEISFSFRNIPSSQSYNCKPKTEGRRATLRQSSIDSSGRLSVLSDESYDSGVGSKSDDDLACLTNSPEKLTSKKPITIEVRSPESSGVIELIDTGDDCFIGYFKPQGSLSTTPTTPTTSATSATSATGGGSSCKVSIQTNSSGRLRRSVSASVSEDSCDSAFHGQKDSSRPSIDLTVLKPKTDTKSKLQTTRKLTHKRKPSKTDLLSSSRAGARSKRDRTVALRRSNRNVLSNRKVRSKQPPPAASSPPSRRTRSRVSTNEPQSPKAKPSPGKSALRRIQHHNRSPERPSESFSSASRHCRTRSHVKSLRNELLTTSPSKPSLRSLNFSTPTKTSADSGLKERKDSADGSISSLKDSDTNGMLNGDRKQDPPVKSACQWRFCKAVVSPADLADHIERLHVASQRRNSKAYKCFWEGCKVYGSVAKSIIWLEGHVKKHLGPRPHHCFFPHCSASFSSQELLQRHVSSHIDQTPPIKAAKKCVAAGRKMEKKSMRRLRGTEKCIPKRADYFTSSILEAIKWEYKMLNEKWPHILTEEKNAFRVRGQIVAMSTNEEKPSEKMVQLHWLPEVLGLPDSWHRLTDPVAASLSKTVKISTIPRSTMLDLYHY